MKLSARNVVPGTITALEDGSVNVEVTVEVAPGIEMSSIITRHFREALDLAIGKRVYLVVKASNVMIGVD